MDTRTLFLAFALPSLSACGAGEGLLGGDDGPVVFKNGDAGPEDGDPPPPPPPGAAPAASASTPEATEPVTAAAAASEAADAAALAEPEAGSSAAPEPDTTSAEASDGNAEARTEIVTETKELATGISVQKGQRSKMMSIAQARLKELADKKGYSGVRKVKISDLDCTGADGCTANATGTAWRKVEKKRE